MIIFDLNFSMNLLDIISWSLSGIIFILVTHKTSSKNESFRVELREEIDSNSLFPLTQRSPCKNEHWSKKDLLNYLHHNQSSFEHSSFKKHKPHRPFIDISKLVTRNYKNNTNKPYGQVMHIFYAEPLLF